MANRTEITQIMFTLQLISNYIWFFYLV